MARGRTTAEHEPDHGPAVHVEVAAAAVHGKEVEDDGDAWKKKLCMKLDNRV